MHELYVHWLDEKVTMCRIIYQLKLFNVFKVIYINLFGYNLT